MTDERRGHIEDENGTNQPSYTAYFANVRRPIWERERVEPKVAPSYEEVRAADAQIKRAWEAVDVAKQALTEAMANAVAAIQTFDKLDDERRTYLANRPFDLADEADDPKPNVDRPMRHVQP